MSEVLSPAALEAAVAALLPELVQVRRDLHRHPEPARLEHRTTGVLARALEARGLPVRRLTTTGLVCDLGPAPVRTGRLRVALRADIDALPVTDTCGAPWESESPGLAHACGHDVHAAVVLGAAVVLAELADRLDTGVRILFQPAEEVMPGGALDVIEQGVMDGVGRIFAVHCDPRLDAGKVGTRIGPITSASDPVTVTLTSAGGHTSRPHLTGDVVHALGQVITQVPAVLGRRLDPRAGVNLTWGHVQAGATHNAIPAVGTLRGTLRCLDLRAWEEASVVLRDAVGHVVAPLGVEAEVTIVRGVPPVVNDAASTALLDEAVRTELGAEALVLTEQSLGGEDFAWLLTKASGALARLGTRGPDAAVQDLHRGDLAIDEDAIAVGVRVLVRAALLATGNVPNP